MDTVSLQRDFLPAGLSPVFVWIGLPLLMALWAALHAWKQRVPARWAGLAFALRVAVGFVALLFAAQAGQAFFVYATNWPLWPVLLTGGALVEAAIQLYQLERRTLPRRMGVTLTCLRVALVLIVIAMLCQPVRIFEFSRRIERHAVLLLDESGSMGVADNGLTPAEKVRLAEKLAVGAARRPFAVERTAARLREAQQRLTAQADWLPSLAGMPVSVSRAARDKRVGEFRETLGEIQKLMADDGQTLKSIAADPLARNSAPDQTALAEIQARLTTDVQGPLEEARKLAAGLMDRGATNLIARADGVLDAIRRAAAPMTEMDAKLLAVGESLDEAYFRSLAEPARREIEAAVGIKRWDLARRLLTRRPGAAGPDDRTGGKPSLVERLRDDYGITAFTFAEQPSKIRVDRLFDGGQTNQPDADASAAKRGTDIAAALDAALRSVPPQQFAGIILVTDGRHNAAESVEPVARKLGDLQAPVCAVVMGGGKRPPTDAAIVTVEGPDNAYTNDKVYLNVDLKLDGLSGTNVTVSLWDGDGLVNTNSVMAVGDAFRKRIQLSDVPKTNGLHMYRIAVQTFAGEVTTNNNACTAPVLVSGDRTRLLFVEGRPRWEFRYLKNLFVNRDTSVRLQYVLLHPDAIAEMPARPERAASVAATGGEDAEATALPKGEDEWLAFDVIILGDVAPAELGAANLEFLKKFVTERGGTLVVIAGPMHMPHAYTGTPLAELLPVVADPAERPLLLGPEPEYRIALTAEGQESVLLRLSDDPQQNAEAWGAVPSIHWRHAIRETKEGASVLAYAQPVLAPGVAGERPGMEVPDEATLARRRKLERENALVVTHNVALGRALYLSFDHTWRLRYRRGDLFHHRFWGQIMRWATADKLPSGTTWVRLGTDRPRYTVGAPIRVRARLSRENLAPNTDASPEAAVWCGDRKILSKRLAYVANSPGVYAADIGTLPEGRYRMELATADIKGLPAGHDPIVSAEFAVTREVAVEDVELAGDRGLLARIAGLTGGKVFEPPEIERVTEKLGPPVVTLRERRQVDVWNSWPLFLLAMLVGGTEWALRKKARLP